MALATILAHGGPAGAAFEVGFVLVPIVVFVILSQISKRWRKGEEVDEPDGGAQ